MKFKRLSDSQQLLSGGNEHWRTKTIYRKCLCISHTSNLEVQILEKINTTKFEVLAELYCLLPSFTVIKSKESKISCHTFFFIGIYDILNLKCSSDPIFKIINSKHTIKFTTETKQMSA